MDIDELRKERDILINERNVISEEMDAYIQEHIGDIRELLAINNMGMPTISEVDLIRFVDFKIINYITKVKIMIKNKIKELKENYAESKGLDNILMAEYFYNNFINANEEKKVFEDDYFVDSFLSLKTGKITLEKCGDKLMEINLSLESNEFKSLDGLFKKDFETKLGVTTMRWNVFIKKIELGLEIFETLYEKTDDEIRGLTSYNYCKEKGCLIFIKNEDILNDKFLNQGTLLINQEIHKILQTEYSEDKKIYLINYLLVMFIGLAPNVNISDFNNMKNYYVLEWARRME